VAIIGGVKISTKLPLLYKLIEIADFVLIGGALANTFFSAQGLDIGLSFSEYDLVADARKLLFHAAQKNTAVILPSDVIIGNPRDEKDGGEIKKIHQIPHGAIILDIGPETQAEFGAIIDKARTIIWNGPVGFFENPAFRRGTDFIYYAIAQNQKAISIIGGGDTLAAISKKEYLDKITHISTGGGAMLEFIEKGSLPGIDALSKKLSAN
jgi:phosphoglycerate kinase